MSNLKILRLLVVLLMGVAVAEVNMKKVKIDIEGMHCASCASNIERSLSKVPGVKNIRISLLMKKGYADVEDSVKEEEIVKAVKRTGYNIKSLEFQ